MSQTTPLHLRNEITAQGLQVSDAVALEAALPIDGPVTATQLIAFRQGLTETTSSENPHFNNDLRATAHYKAGSRVAQLRILDRVQEVAA